jgi:hypothetical protein
MLMDRRFDARIDCADNILVTWLEKTGPRQQKALLLNISRTGARLHAPYRIPVGTQVEIAYLDGKLLGKVTHCLARKPHHNLWISFAPDSEWSRRTYWPKGAKGLGPTPNQQ